MSIYTMTRNGVTYRWMRHLPGAWKRAIACPSGFGWWVA
jgi:hypothetical protein